MNFKNIDELTDEQVLSLYEVTINNDFLSVENSWCCIINGTHTPCYYYVTSGNVHNTYCTNGYSGRNTGACDTAVCGRINGASIVGCFYGMRDGRCMYRPF